MQRFQIQKFRPKLRRYDRLLAYAERLRGDRRAVDAFAHRSAEAGCAHDQNGLVRLRRDDRLVRGMGLERQALGAVGLDDHVAGKRAERAERQLRRGVFSAF